MTVDATATIEPAIAGFWREVLEVPEVSGSDRLLELGGNSLAATMIANRIELVLGVRPTMTEILTSSLHELAVTCAERAADAGG
ncbi:MAG TPA: phosphopantetheine-binding protein [Solirubrobacteraceae bacterium]|jgi:acyl carrier protein|nr:phosphopantetheine-binding protein [Solirubrobacteraceae bacterium]